MKKILTIVCLMSLTTASAADLIRSSNNPSFYEEVRKLGFGYCMPNTYSAFISTQDDGSQFNITPSQSREYAMQVYREQKWKLLKTFVNPTTHTDITEVTLTDGTIARSASKLTYVNGYELIQRCRLHR